ncbi:hypothetical protein QUF50_02310 [Thiotrichales bacterium HSG1]|nr:hypothetical protein [Thiotrichales bacterium HSG1]
MFNLKTIRQIIFVFSCTSLMMGGVAVCEAADSTNITPNNPCNPCGPKNPCNINPCNPCGAKNPCASDSKAVTRPAGTKLMTGNQEEFLQEGEKLWSDISLGNNGMSCQTCHKQGKSAFGQTFAEPYPHTVGMVKGKFGVEQVELDEMVQFCIIEPMAGKPLAWDSKQLAALTAYTQKLQNEYK